MNMKTLPVTTLDVEITWCKVKHNEQIVFEASISWSHTWLRFRPSNVSPVTHTDTRNPHLNHSTTAPRGQWSLSSSRDPAARSVCLSVSLEEEPSRWEESTRDDSLPPPSPSSYIPFALRSCCTSSQPNLDRFSRRQDESLQRGRFIVHILSILTLKQVEIREISGSQGGEYEY
jgi:hypothetical protein